MPTPTLTITLPLTSPVPKSPTSPIVLALSATPMGVAPGELVTFTIVLSNPGDTPLAGVVVSATLGDGLHLLPRQPGWDYQRPNHLTARLPDLLPGVGVTLTLQARATGPLERLATAFVAAMSGGETLAEASAEVWVAHPTRAQIGRDGGVLRSPDGRVRVEFPAGVLDDIMEATISVSPPASPQARTAEREWDALFYFTLDARDTGTGQARHRFAQPVTLTVDLRGYPGEWQHFYLVRRDEASPHRWEVVPSEYDPERGMLTALRENFSGYGVVSGREKAPLHHILTVLPEVNAFTGAATYVYPLDLPAGRNGLTPQLALSYNSGALNGIMGVVQSGEVGIGWSLAGAMEIVRHVAGWREWSGDRWETKWEYYNDFYLVVNGTSHHLVGPEQLPNYGGCRYYAEDAPDMRIIRYTPNVAVTGGPALCGYGTAGAPPNTTGEYWIVTDGNGTSYRFGYTSDAEQLAPMYLYRPENCYKLDNTAYAGCWDYWRNFHGYAGQAINRVAYRWSVDRIWDVHGNTVRYQYGEVNRYVANVGDMDRERHLVYIHYGGNETQGTPAQYEIYFQWEPRVRSNDRAGAWPDCATAHDDGLDCEVLLQNERPWAFWDSYRIDAIYICAGSCATPANRIAKYDLDYQFVTEDPPGLDFTILPHQTTRLASITRYGRNGEALPAVTFYYGNGGGESPPQMDNEKDKADGAYYGLKLRYPRLLAVNNGYGGQVTFVYNSASPYNYCGVYSYVATRKDVADGLGHTARVEYVYTDPCFDGHDGWPNCRRDASPSYGLIGHRQTTVRAYDYGGGLLNRTEHYFYTEMSIRQGQEYQTATYDANGTLLRQVNRTWTVATSNGGWARLDREQQTDYSGSLKVSTRVDYSHDEYSNITAEYHYGAVNPDTGENAGYEGDERTIHRVYTRTPPPGSSTKWRGRPSTRVSTPPTTTRTSPAAPATVTTEQSVTTETGNTGNVLRLRGR